MSLEEIQTSLNEVKVTLENMDVRLSRLETLDTRMKYVEVFNKSQYSYNKFLLHQISLIQNRNDDSSKEKINLSRSNDRTTASNAIFDPTFKNNENDEASVESVGKQSYSLGHVNLFPISI